MCEFLSCLKYRIIYDLLTAKCSILLMHSSKSSQARRGARDAQRDIQVPLAPSPSRRVAKGPRHVLRPPWRGTTRRAMAPTNDLTPRCERRLRCASPSGRLAQPALASLPRAPRLGASRLPCLVARNSASLSKYLPLYCSVPPACHRRHRSSEGSLCVSVSSGDMADTRGDRLSYRANGPAS